MKYGSKNATDLTGEESCQVDTQVRQHNRDEHYFNCGYCGYVGLESELLYDPDHKCGKDQCPECKEEYNITCCYLTYEDAENRENSVA